MRFWFGCLYFPLQQFIAEGIFLFDDGGPVSWTYWRVGKPNDDEHTDNCIEIYYDNLALPDRQWNDYACDESNRYIICEKTDSGKLICWQQRVCEMKLVFVFVRKAPRAGTSNLYGYTAKKVVKFDPWNDEACASPNANLKSRMLLVQSNCAWELIRWRRVFNIDHSLNGLRMRMLEDAVLTFNFNNK